MLRNQTHYVLYGIQTNYNYKVTIIKLANRERILHNYDIQNVEHESSFLLKKQQLTKLNLMWEG